MKSTEALNEQGENKPSEIARNNGATSNDTAPDAQSPLTATKMIAKLNKSQSETPAQTLSPAAKRNQRKKAAKSAKSAIIVPTSSTSSSVELREQPKKEESKGDVANPPITQPQQLNIDPQLSLRDKILTQSETSTNLRKQQLQEKETAVNLREQDLQAREVEVSLQEQELQEKIQKREDEVKLQTQQLETREAALKQQQELQAKQAVKPQDDQPLAGEQKSADVQPLPKQEQPVIDQNSANATNKNIELVKKGIGYGTVSLFTFMAVISNGNPWLYTIGAGVYTANIIHIGSYKGETILSSLRNNFAAMAITYCLPYPMSLGCRISGIGGICSLTGTFVQKLAERIAETATDIAIRMS